MAEPISRARLVQIAQRKLAALGIPFRSDGDSIKGELATGAYGLKNPASGARIDVVKFEVEGHDRLRLTDPPALRELAAMPYYDQDSVGAIVNQLASALERRNAAAQTLASRMRQQGFDVIVDPERLVAAVRMELPGQGTVVLEGTEKGLVPSRLLAPPGSTRPPIPLGGGPLDMREFPDRVDLELFVGTLADRALSSFDYVPPSGALPGGLLGNEVPGAEGAALFASLGEIHAADDSLAGMRYFEGMAGAPRGSNAAFAAPSVPRGSPSVALTPGPPRLTPQPMPAAGLPAISVEALARAFGGDARISGGVLISREVRHGGQTIQFTARQEGPRSFLARLTGQGGVIAEVHVDLDTFRGVEQLVQDRVASQAYAPAPPAVLPTAGQVWMMEVRVDREDAEGLHYSMVNAEGRPAGSAKVLRRPEFEATFAVLGGKPRLLARVIDVVAGQVGYVQLDPRRQAVGGARRSSLSSFTTNFRPENG